MESASTPWRHRETETETMPDARESSGTDASNEHCPRGLLVRYTLRSGKGCHAVLSIDYESYFVPSPLRAVQVSPRGEGVCAINQISINCPINHYYRHTVLSQECGVLLPLCKLRMMKTGRRSPRHLLSSPTHPHHIPTMCIYLSWRRGGGAV
jgi:hypothetical protein